MGSIASAASRLDAASPSNAEGDSGDEDGEAAWWCWADRGAGCVAAAAIAQLHWLRGLGCRSELWKDEDNEPLLTDNGNYLARCWFEDGIVDPDLLAGHLEGRPGILEHGLFLNMAKLVVVADEDGVMELEPSR